MPSADVVERRVRREARERAAVVVAGRRERVEDLGESVRARDSRRCSCPPAATLAMAVPTSTTSGGISSTSDAIFISYASIFLPRYSGVRPTMRPAMNTATMREHQHAVEAAADAAEHDLAELHEPHRHEPAERRERVVHRVHGAVRRRGRRRGPERGVRDAEARLLAFHVAAGLQRRTRPDRRRAPRAADCRPARPRYAPNVSGTKITSIAASTAQPWRVSPTMRPNV